MKLTRTPYASKQYDLSGSIAPALKSRWEEEIEQQLRDLDPLEMAKLDSIPTKNRDIEKFIDPFNNGWEHRYYKALFNIDINKYWRKKICMNYLEGLEWTMKYYSSGCVSWDH